MNGYFNVFNNGLFRWRWLPKNCLKSWTSSQNITDVFYWTVYIFLDKIYQKGNDFIDLLSFKVYESIMAKTRTFTVLFDH